MKATFASVLLAALGAACVSTFGTSCNTVEEPSPYMEKIREDSDIGTVKPRERRRRPH
ncbi:MAG: hypothetical protein ACR2RV_04485 [Verrucomicrobiales bacterium]